MDVVTDLGAVGQVEDDVDEEELDRQADDAIKEIQTLEWKDDIVEIKNRDPLLGKQDLLLCGSGERLKTLGIIPKATASDSSQCDITVYGNDGQAKGKITKPQSGGKQPCHVCGKMFDSMPPSSSFCWEHHLTVGNAYICPSRKRLATVDAEGVGGLSAILQKSDTPTKSIQQDDL